MYDTELPEEVKILLRDLTQAARTVIDVRGHMKYGVDMFRLALRQEALERTRDDQHPLGNQCKAARMLKEHRNTFTRGLRIHDQYKKPARSQDAARLSAHAG